MAIIIAVAFTIVAGCFLLLAWRATRLRLQLIMGIIISCVGAFTFVSVEPQSLAVIVGLISFFGPWVFIWFEIDPLRRIAFDSYVRKHIKADHVDWFDKSGIALDSKNRKLVLAGKKLQRIYDFEEIRAWKTSFLCGGTTRFYASAGHDPLDDLDWGASDTAADLRSGKTSSLFVRVRDIEHPEWQIQGIGDRQTMHWFELLQQHVANERA